MLPSAGAPAPPAAFQAPPRPCTSALLAGPAPAFRKTCAGTVRSAPRKGDASGAGRVWPGVEDTPCAPCAPLAQRRGCRTPVRRERSDSSSLECARRVSHGTQIAPGTRRPRSPRTCAREGCGAASSASDSVSAAGRRLVLASGTCEAQTNSGTAGDRAENAPGPAIGATAASPMCCATRPPARHMARGRARWATGAHGHTRCPRRVCAASRGMRDGPGRSGTPVPPAHALGEQAR